MSAEAEQDAKDREFMKTMDADAILYIRNAADMTEDIKLAIAEWLQVQASSLLSDGHNYNFLYRATYED